MLLVNPGHAEKLGPHGHIAIQQKSWIYVVKFILASET